MFVIHSLHGWPFLRLLAPSGAIQWTASFAMAQHFATREEAEAEAFLLSVRWALEYDLEILTLDEAKVAGQEFHANHGGRYS